MTSIDFFKYVTEKLQTKNFKIIYIKKEDIYIIEPSSQFENNDSFFLHDDRKNVTILDEHGKLVSVAHVHNTIDGHQAEILEFDKSIHSKLFDHDYTRNDLEYLIEDYKLKKLISRMINIVTNQEKNVVPKKHQRGSTELEHLLWMLLEINTNYKSLSKRANWIGTIQGILAAKNIIDIKHEHDIMKHIL